MDYFGVLLDDLTEMADELEARFPHDGQRALRAMRRLMQVVFETERERHRKMEDPGAALPVFASAEKHADQPSVAADPLQRAA